MSGAGPLAGSGFAGLATPGVFMRGWKRMTVVVTLGLDICRGHVVASFLYRSGIFWP